MARYVDIENCEDFVDSMAGLLESCHFKHKTGCFAPDCRECLRRSFTPFNSDYLLPTADVEPVRHGEWRLINIFPSNYIECSECRWGDYMRPQIEEYRYCPYCGAKMDKEEQR